MLFTAYIEDEYDSQATIKYADRREYKGKINGQTFLPEGMGKMEYPNGSHYYGTWEAGKQHGEGCFIWADRSEYSGNYVHGVKAVSYTHLTLPTIYSV